MIVHLSLVLNNRFYCNTLITCFLIILVLIYQSIGALGRVFGPAFGGILYDLNFSAPYIAGGLVCLASLYIVFDLIKNKMEVVATKEGAGVTPTS